jgi:integrase
VVALAQACLGPYAELVYVLAMQGLRWGELAGLQVGDRVLVPGPGLRLSRAVLASNGGGELYVDTLKNKRARTVPLVPVVVPIVDRWSAGKSPGEWLFRRTPDAPDLLPRRVRSVGNVLGDTPGIRHDRQGGIDAGSGREWAAVHHEEVVDLVAPAPAVQHGGFRVVAHARRAVLV